MAVDCSPEALAEASKCFMCFSPKQLDAINTLNLARIANALTGSSMDPEVLARDAAAFQALDGQQMQVQNFLLCNIANAT